MNFVNRPSQNLIFPIFLGKYFEEIGIFYEGGSKRFLLVQRSRQRQCPAIFRARFRVCRRGNSNFEKYIQINQSLR